MHALASTFLALSLVAPDPRTIDPDASRPDIVTEGDAPAPVIRSVPPPVSNRPPPPPPPVAGDRPPPVDRPPSGTPPAGTPPTVTPVGTPPTTTPPAGGQPQVTRPPEGPVATVDTTQGCFAARGRCRRLSIAGFATLGTGVGLLATGIAFTQVAPFPLDEEPVFNRSLAPPGKALLGVGIVAAVAGALLVVSGFAVHRRFQAGDEKLAKVRLDTKGLHW